MTDRPPRPPCVREEALKEAQSRGGCLEQSVALA